MRFFGITEAWCAYFAGKGTWFPAVFLWADRRAGVTSCAFPAAGFPALRKISPAGTGNGNVICCITTGRRIPVTGRCWGRLRSGCAPSAGTAGFWTGLPLPAVFPLPVFRFWILAAGLFLYLPPFYGNRAGQRPVWIRCFSRTDGRKKQRTAAGFPLCFATKAQSISTRRAGRLPGYLPFCSRAACAPFPPGFCRIFLHPLQALPERIFLLFFPNGGTGWILRTFRFIPAKPWSGQPLFPVCKPCSRIRRKIAAGSRSCYFKKAQTALECTAPAGCFACFRSGALCHCAPRKNSVTGRRFHGEAGPGLSA